MERLADLPLRWHLIGHLQSNKARKAGAQFDVIQTVDRVAIGDTIEEAARTSGHEVTVLAQVDIAGETTKHGAPEAELPSLFEAAKGWRACRMAGLMLLPPLVENPEDARPYFKALTAVRDRLLARGVDPPMLVDMSMGMSHDFEVAVEEGATLVRVGTAIFGSRSHV